MANEDRSSPGERGPWLSRRSAIGAGLAAVGVPLAWRLGTAGATEREASGGFDPGRRYRIRARHSGKVLEVAGASRDPGATVQQWDDAAFDNQRWYVEAVERWRYRIVAAHSDHVLEVADGSTEDGGNVQQGADEGTPHQRWYVHPVHGGCYRILNARSEKALDVAAVSHDAGGNVHQWEYLGGHNQQWYIEAVDSSK